MLCAYFLYIYYVKTKLCLHSYVQFLIKNTKQRLFLLWWMFFSFYYDFSLKTPQNTRVHKEKFHKHDFVFWLIFIWTEMFTIFYCYLIEFWWNINNSDYSNFTLHLELRNAVYYRFLRGDDEKEMKERFWWLSTGEWIVLSQPKNQLRSQEHKLKAITSMI